MRRRDFIAGLGVVAWPIAAQAQPAERVRRIGVLMPFDENDPLAKPYLSAFTEALAESGRYGRNARMDLRWGGADINRTRALAQELVGLHPDILVSAATAATVALQRETQMIPIVFVNAGDPVANGLVPAA